MATPDIVVQIKGGKSTVISAPTGSATRLVELGDVNIENQGDGKVLTYVAANSRYEFVAQASASATDQFARDRANGAFTQANTANVTGQAAFDQANGAIYTAAQIRANVSNTAPIDYNATSGVISHADSGVVATTYGNTTFVPTISVDARGHVTSITNTAIALPPSTDEFARSQANAAYNQANAATIIATSAYAQANIATSNADAAFARANASYANANTALYTAGQVRANISNTAPINYSPTTGVISHADSGVVATTYGNTTFVPTITVDARGHVTAVTNTAIALPPSTDEFARAHANAAYNQANTATTTGQAAFNQANGAIYTAAQIRANLSNTAPINYDPSTGIISHALSGVTASGYGDGATVAKVVVDSNGHVTSVTNNAIAISASQITSGTLGVNRGGTGQTAITVNGSLLIGNTVSGGFDVNSLTQGSGIAITNDKGSITIAATGGSAIDQYARDKANGAAQQAFVTIAIAGQSDVVAESNTDTLTLVAGTGIQLTTDAGTDTITVTATGGSAIDQFARDTANGAALRANTLVTDNVPETTTNLYFTAARTRANVSNTAPINYNSSTGVFSHALSGAVAAQHGDAATIPVVTVNDTGHVTGVTNTAVAISASQVTSGTLAVVRGGTGQTAITVNGSLLIGNTVSGGFDVNPITQGTNITITNDKGSITIASSDAFAQAQANAAYARANAAFANANTAIYTAAQIRVNVSNTTPINYEPSTGVFSHASSGVTATGHGDAATIPTFIVNATGHVTSVTNAAVAIAASQVTSGTLAIARGGTGQTAITVNGSLLIGNTVSGGFDVNPITQGTNITITNDKGSVTIASSDAFAQAQANAAYTRANAAYANANTALYTAAQVRSNVSATTPISYDSGTGVFSHATSGVTATGHGDAATIPVLIVNATGHVTSVTNTAVALAASQITSGTLVVARGGTGQTAASLVNGAVLIGNTVSGGYDLNRLTQGTGIEITNDKGSITIAATGGSAIDQYARDKANGAVQTGFTILAVAGQSDIAPDSNTDTLTIVGSGITITTDASTDTLTLTHPTSGAPATSHGDAATIPVFTLNGTGHVTAVTNTAIAISASQVTSGTLAVGRGGTGQTAITVNGSLLIGNTVSGGFDVNPITATTPIVIANDKGSIAFSHATSGVTATGHGDAATIPTFVVNAQGHITSVTNTTVAITTSQVSESVGGPFFHTAARVRGNVSATTPISYDSGTGVFSHATSGVTATGHGDAATIPVFTVTATGHVTAVTNTAIAISASQITSGTLAVGRGGTGQTAASLVNGAVLIGNTVSGGYDLNRLTQGTGIEITNDKGSITITATGGSAIDQYARDKANGAVQTGFTIFAVAGQSDIVPESNTDTITIVGSGITITTDAGTDTLTLTHPTSGVAATGHGDAATIPVFIVNAQGHVTAVTNTTVAIAASQIASGILSIARGGTAQSAITVNGATLIANTVSGGYDVNPITATTPIIVTNDKGSIALTHATSGVTATGHGDGATIPVFTVSSMGHVTSVTNTAVAIAASQVTSGVLIQAQGGTGFSGATANGQLLIGNTVSGGFDRATLTQGTNITITNEKGAITITGTGGGGDSFGTIAVAGQSNIVADQTNDTLTVVAGTGVTITTDAGTDTMTLSAADVFASLQANAAFAQANTADARAQAGRDHANGAFAAANAASTLGQHQIWVPAWAMYPAMTNGASAANGAFETGTNDQVMKTLDYDTTTVEAAQFTIKMPRKWNAGTLFANAVWSHGTTTTNFGVTWQFDAVAIDNDEAMDTAFGSAIEVSDTGGTTNNMYVSAQSGAITVGSTPAKGSWVFFRVRRAVANGSDTLAIDARLHGVEITYTTDASTDA